MKRVPPSIVFACAVAIIVAGQPAPSLSETKASGTAVPLAGTPLTPVYSASGHVGLSVDALGTQGSTGSVQVDKHAGAMVRAAYPVSYTHLTLPTILRV